MSERLGLRERKKLRTREAISDAAVRLFLERGFDSVTVAEIAEAAEVSSMTVFNHFPAKEDLVLCRIDDHFGEAAAIVRACGPEDSPLEALLRHFVSGLDERNPSTGLCDEPGFLAFQRMIMHTPSLKLRLVDQWLGSRSELAAALAGRLGEEPEGIAPTIAALQITAAQQALVSRNLERVLAGRDLETAHAEAVADAERAFFLLEHGLARFNRPSPTA
ncbi:TetR family transcriptional regulator [Streptomyces humidus]|uniref:TetR family transcriptional regulator n=1 Tax=Streptomyces humidus TaxID=52259 RepID=A0A918L588_9ACTN|nr:TetR/AcrR family transcriptional regulator [Streptomyces humidus]GGS05651.1 TetR family transcriptional regulator [Streptomyces humidus]